MIQKKKWKACFPFMLNLDNEKYSYKESSNKITTKFQDRNNSLIRVYTQSNGSTFEYELIFENYTCKKLITDSVQNKTEIIQFMESINPEMTKQDLLNLIEKIREGNFKTKIKEYFEKNETSSAFEKAKHIGRCKIFKINKKR